MTGGLLSIVQGGNFVSGFLAAGVGSLGGPMLDEAPGIISAKGVFVSAALGGVAAVLGGGKFQNGAITSAFAYVASNLAARDTALARSNDPIKGPEIPAAEREKIIGDAIAQFQAEGGSGIIINAADTYEITDGMGGYDHYDTLAQMNAGIATHEAESGNDWGYVDGWSNGLYSVIYASAAYPQSELYGLLINPATSTLFMVWHENGHQGWPMGGNCMWSSSPESCANNWAKTHVH